LLQENKKNILHRKAIIPEEWWLFFMKVLNNFIFQNPGNSACLKKQTEFWEKNNIKEHSVARSLLVLVSLLSLS
jgi:hypothetical protein